MRELRVLHLPWSDSNAYQRQLAESLRGLGIVSFGGPGHHAFLAVQALRWKPDILHFHWPDAFFMHRSSGIALCKAFAFASQILMARALGLRIVWTAHDLAPHENHFPWLERRAMQFFVRRCHAVIAHSRGAREQILARFPFIPARQVSVIPHGHYAGFYTGGIERPEARRRLGLEERGLVFLFFGQIRRYKGVDLLIEAFRRVPGALRAVLLIVGETPDEDFGRVVHDMAAAEPRIRYSPGFVPNDQVQLYLKACDAVVLPYREGFTSGVAILATTFGRACITTPTLAAIETLGPDGAVFAAAASAESIADALARAASREIDLDSIGRRNQAAAEKWDWKGIAERTAELYGETTAG